MAPLSLFPRVLFRASRYNSIVFGYLVFRSAQVHNDSGKEGGWSGRGGGGLVLFSISSFPISLAMFALNRVVFMKSNEIENRFFNYFENIVGSL